MTPRDYASGYESQENRVVGLVVKAWRSGHKSLTRISYRSGRSKVMFFKSVDVDSHISYANKAFTDGGLEASRAQR